MAKRSILLLAASALAASAAWAAPRADPVVAAALKTERAGSAKIAFRTAAAGGGVSFTVTGGGVVSGRAARMTFRYPRGLMPGAADPSAEMIFLLEKGAPVVYMRFGFLRDQLPPGKRWIRMDLARQGKKLGIDTTTLLGGLDWSSESALLEYAHTTRRLGVEKVLGERMVRYRTRIDLERAARDDPKRAEALRMLIALSGAKTMTMDVWVDSAGYLRRLLQTVAYRDASSGQRLRAATTVSYLSFGRPVSIKAPPAGEVVDVSALGG